MKSNSSAKIIAFLGVMFALLFIFLFIETVLFKILFGFYPPSVLALPLAIALSIKGRKKPMFIGGTLFGCSSFIIAIITSNFVFLNPLISILPRIFIGLFAYLIYHLTTKIIKNDIICYSISGIVGVLTNTVCTLFMIWVFNQGSLLAVLTTILSINFVAEIIASIILVPVFAKTIDVITKRLRMGEYQ